MPCRQPGGRRSVTNRLFTSLSTGSVDNLRTAHCGQPVHKPASAGTRFGHRRVARSACGSAGAAHASPEVVDANAKNGLLLRNGEKSAPVRDELRDLHLPPCGPPPVHPDRPGAPCLGFCTVASTSERTGHAEHGIGDAAILRGREPEVEEIELVRRCRRRCRAAAGGVSATFTRAAERSRVANQYPPSAPTTKPITAGSNTWFKSPHPLVRARYFPATVLGNLRAADQIRAPGAPLSRPL